MKEKIRSKYILLLFVGIIVLLFGGIFFAAQQEKEGPITAEAASVYWGSASIPTTCPSCGTNNADLRIGSYSSSGSCEVTLIHYRKNASGGGGGDIPTCYTPIVLHSVVSVPEKKPTCTTAGYYAYSYCGRCHAYATSYIQLPALGHDFGDWTEDKDAGVETRTCSRCGATETRALPEYGSRLALCYGQYSGHYDLFLRAFTARLTAIITATRTSTDATTTAAMTIARSRSLIPECTGVIFCVSVSN